LSTGEVSPATEAMSLQGRPKVGLIIHCQELNAYVLSAGTILFVQNQSSRVRAYVCDCKKTGAPDRFKSTCMNIAITLR
ncbi:MAG: hypothetical protein AAGG53_12625, partial [Cyanobacteria bacterium P01_H01_bin.152]